MDDLAFRVAGMAEAEYERIADLLSHDMSRVIMFRVAPANQTFPARTVNAAIIPFNGSYADCTRRLSFQIALSMHDDILRGASGMRELTTRQGIPGWIRYGLARYISEGGHRIDVCALDPPKGLSGGRGAPAFTAGDAETFGPEFFRYLESRFGGRVMGDFLREMGETGDYEQSLAAVTGREFQRLAREWSDYCMLRRSREKNNIPERYITIPVNIDPHEREGGILAVAPDGRRIALLEKGPAHPVIRIYDTNSGLLNRTIGISRSVLRAGHKVVIPSENNLSWDDRGELLLFAASGRVGPALYLLDIRTAAVSEVLSLPFSVIMHPSLSPDGNRIVFAAVGSSSSDIYIINRRTHVISRLTDDALFECHPTFTPDGKKVLYSSTVNARSDYGTSACSIITHDIRTGVASMTIHSGGSDLHPAVSPDGDSILYSEERDGRSAIRMYSAQSGANSPLVIPGLLASRPSWFPDSKRFACFILKKGGWTAVIGTVSQGAISNNPGVQ